jgi:hypothetical protein
MKKPQLCSFYSNVTLNNDRPNAQDVHSLQASAGWIGMQLP